MALLVLRCDVRLLPEFNWELGAWFVLFLSDDIF